MIVDHAGAEPVWRISLSDRPPPEWIRYFGCQPALTSACRPTLASFDRATILFTSDEAWVGAWMEQIHRWVNAANTAYLAARDQRRQDLFVIRGGEATDVGEITT